MIMTIKEIVLTPDLANYCTVAAALKVIDDYMTGQFDNEAALTARLNRLGQSGVAVTDVAAVAAAPEFGAESSMMEWDSHGLHT